MIIKKYKSKVISFMVIFVISVTACTKNFEDLNTSKTSIAASNMNAGLLGQLFAQAQYVAPTGAWYQVWYNLHADTWAQYWAQHYPGYPHGQFEEQGVYTSISNDNFYKAMTQLKFVKDFTEENSMLVENAIAKVESVLLFARHTDSFGPIIYSQFGNEKTSVAYDSQEDIYHDFFKTLDEAVDVLSKNKSKVGFGEHDLFYRGDAAKWLVFANSLRLRLAMRISYVDEVLSKAEAEKAMTAPGGVMVNNTDNALLTSTVDSKNYLSQITYHMEWGMTSTMESILTGYKDPRLNVYFQQCCGRLADKDNSGVYKGIRNGLKPEQRGVGLQQENSYLGTRYLREVDGGKNLPTAFLTAAEVYFLRAEGSLRGYSNMGGTPMELYNQGIRASLKFMTEISDSEIEKYINSTNTPTALNDAWNSPPVASIPVVYQSGANFETQLEQIITQKWIAGFPDNGHNSWAERRRTGYPRGYAIIKSTNTTLKETDLFRRLKFTQGEISNNFKAVEDARKLLNGPDNNATRVWWDAKPLSDFPDLSSSVVK